MNISKPFLALLLALLLAVACGSSTKTADDQPTEEKAEKRTFEQRLETARDRAREALVHIEADIERATSTKPLATEAEDAHKVGLADLKVKLDQLAKDIDSLLADSKTEKDLVAAEKKIEAELEVLNRKSKELLRGKSEPAGAPEGAAEDATDEAGSDE